MRYQRILHAGLLLTVVAAMLGQPRFAVAQSSFQQKPVLRDFGSSLKRLKWDFVSNSAVEINSKNGKHGDGTVEDVLRVKTDLVVSEVLVLDPQDKPVQGLTQDDFIATEDGASQQISHFSLGDLSADRSIVLVIDYSISQLPYLNTSIDSAKVLVDQLSPRDRMAIVTDDVELLADFTRDKAELKSALEALRQKALTGKTGKSSQFSALMATVRELVNNEDSQSIVIFQTDGDELQFLQPPGEAISKLPEWQYNIKQYGLNDITTAANKSRVTIHTVISGVRILGLPQNEQLERANIIFKTAAPRSRYPGKVFMHYFAERTGQLQAAASEMAEATGGTTSFLENAGQASDMYSRILSDLNRRYVIGYYPTNRTQDASRRRIQIKVRNHPEYTVRGRRSYMAGAPDQ